MNATMVILTGGPTSLRTDDRIRLVTDLAERIKVQHGNGYEHFKATGESLAHDAAELPVFAWYYQTKIAE
jgi:Family of unknown function (DUF5988)